MEKERSPGDVYQLLKKWTMKEQLFKLDLNKNEKVEWAFQITYPFNHPNPLSYVVFNPVGKDLVVIEINVRMSPAHRQAFNKKGRAALEFFYARLKKIFLDKDISYNIIQQQDTWIASDQIYYDGLTKDHFFSTIRRLHNGIILGNILVNEVLALNFTKGNLPGVGGSSENSTGVNLYS